MPSGELAGFWCCGYEARRRLIGQLPPYDCESGRSTEKSKSDRQEEQIRTHSDITSSIINGFNNKGRSQSNKKK